MAKNYDIISIGLGPAGMAVSAMASSMGLKTLAIEKHKLGGECMNVGCVPSKALLKRAKIANFIEKIEEYQLSTVGKTKPQNIFFHIRRIIDEINQGKNSKMLDKIDIVFGEASFVDSKTIEANGETFTAKKIFICVGTRPAMPPILGIDEVEALTNEKIFELDEIPPSIAIIGGGAIGTEMAEAFSRLGAKATIIHDGEHLVPAGDDEAAALIEESFKKQGIVVFNKRFAGNVRKSENEIIITTDKGEEIKAQKLLIAAGRRYDFKNLNLEKSGIATDKRGAIIVNPTLETNVKNIYAVGDCNGNALFSHASMHQAMLAITNTLLPFGFKKKFKNYVVPWTVFTDPAFSAVGMSEKELKAKKINYETIKTNYSDYGAALIENSSEGFIKVFASPLGRIYGAVAIGENSGELINEWAMAIHNNIRLYNILMQQHSFPTMGFLNKRIAEIWMMKRLENPLLKKAIQLWFRVLN